MNLHTLTKGDAVGIKGERGAFRFLALHCNDAGDPKHVDLYGPIDGAKRKLRCVKPEQVRQNTSEVHP